ncbi:DUF2501 domain-containing protein [Rhodanobacter sp. MP7CTX1]|jgi:hypothetical protein|uniref:DUF2501 domain-containing protein n=1 Tax=Rhodanobacter sp. MP7CTX1 TaxID=2723084 RepID=UPI0017F86B03|nr:DUF2501 domain-containing protein [Rhodanobacter sp. MP7CTX1]MBB6186779.1 hypothetical protein [Rhodanobacter sp. MP7CTX1]
MKNRIGGLGTTCAVIALSLACGATGAQDMGALGGKLGAMVPVSSMTSGSMGNVAGLLQYCVKNNYLGGASGASGIQNQLLGKMGGASNPAATSGGDYKSGANGILQAGNGKSMDLSSVGGGSSDMKSKITTKVCDTVLKQGKSYLGQGM